MSGSILFRSPNWLGDAVMATVVPPALKRITSEERVGVLVPAGIGDVFRGHPAVDEVLEFAPGGEVDAYRRGGYDRVLLAPVSFGSVWRAMRGGVRERYGFGGSGRDLLLRRRLPGHEYRRDRHQVENYRALAGLAGTPRPADEPDVRVTLEATRAARELWGDSTGRRVAVQPGATYGPAKRWPASRFAALARTLSGRDCTVAVLGGPGDRESTEAVCAEAGSSVRDLSGRTTVETLAAVLREASILVTNDTGPMHLAAAVGTPVLAMFGSTDPDWTGPRGDGHRVMRVPVECSPCFRRDCRIGLTCFTEIGIDAAVAEARAMLEETS